MAFRGGASVIAISLAATSFAGGALASTADDEPVVISGVGAAHGFGMAMDGVEGQARGGWTHERILDLFYPGTTTGHAGGTIRVGLADGPAATVGLPNGGVIADAPKSGKPTIRIAVPSGTKIGLRRDGGLIVVTRGVPRTTPSASEHTPPRQEPPPDLIPTPPPAEAPVVVPTATPAPRKKGPPAGPATSVDGALRKPRFFVWGTGDPALVSVDATGRRYRGQMEIKPGTNGLVVVNHVDLETYVRGIAEEKGQAWPLAGLRSLAVAARSLGAATMSWYHKNTANGYDICPSENCQVYLGYDGEEPAMTRAVAETAGQIRVHNGRPILAMYHGNGGGQTESYAKVIDNGTDPYPYLRSVKYPFASPSTWQREWTLPKIEASLRDAGVGVPAKIERITVAERGESPRVVRVRIDTMDGTDELSGVTFANALDLPSTWFDVGPTTATSRTTALGLIVGGLASESRASAPAPTSPWPGFITTIGALCVLVAADRMRRKPVDALARSPRRAATHRARLSTSASRVLRTRILRRP
jgi:SpoIID/LytB domain protein